VYRVHTNSAANLVAFNAPHHALLCCWWHISNAMYFAIPLINYFSVKIQITILLSLLFISYLNRGARFVIAGLATVYLAFKLLIPLFRLLFWIFKGIAMFGFYVHFFSVGAGFIITAVAFVFGDGLEMLLRELEKRKTPNETRRDG